MADAAFCGVGIRYRPKTNSYDGWSVADYEQYIIDLALFGTNLIGGCSCCVPMCAQRSLCVVHNHVCACAVYSV